MAKIGVQKIYFGAAGYSDYIISGGDDDKKRRYILRHKKRENWKDPLSPGSLSRCDGPVMMSSFVTCHK